MKGYSLHVGVSDVDSNHYGRELKSYGAKNDATDLRQLLLDTKLYEEENTVLLTEENATSEMFFSEIELLISKTNESKEESYIVLTFSGHGTAYKFNREKEPLEFLCFRDRMVLEYEISNVIHEFCDRVKLFIIIDSCYSNGIALAPLHYHHKSKESFVPEAKTRNVKALTNIESTSIFNHGDNLRYYRRLVRKTGHSHDPFTAETCFLTACSKDAVTYDAWSTDGRSLFTDVLIMKWKDKSFTGNYNQLHNKITESITRHKGPRISHDKAIYFKNHKPFIYNLKLPNMSWTVEIDYQKEPLHATVTHPNFPFKAGSIISTFDPNHELLSGWNPIGDQNANPPANPVEYQNGDLILILILEEATGHAKTTTTFNLKRKLDPTKHTIFVIPYDNKTGEKRVKGNGSRSSSKVSDELGGSGH